MSKAAFLSELDVSSENRHVKSAFTQISTVCVVRDVIVTLNGTINGPSE